MTQQVVLTSLGELAGVRGLFAEVGPVPEARALVPVIRGTGPEEIGKLAQAARQALGELQELLARDGERRLEAEQGLGRLRAVRAKPLACERSPRSWVRPQAVPACSHSRPSSPRPGSGRRAWRRRRAGS